MPTTKKPKLNLLDADAYDLGSYTSGQADEIDAEADGDMQGLYKRLASLYPGTQITSLTRTPKHNAEVGGKPNSQHLRGTAGDFVVPNDLKGAFREEVRGRGLESIDEGDHIHVELPPGKDTSSVNAETPGTPNAPATSAGVTLPRHTGKYKYNALDANAFDLDPRLISIKPVEVVHPESPVLPVAARKDKTTSKDTTLLQDAERQWHEVTHHVVSGARNMARTVQIDDLRREANEYEQGGRWVLDPADHRVNQGKKWVPLDKAEAPEKKLQLVMAMVSQADAQQKADADLAKYPQAKAQEQRRKEIDEAEGFWDTVGANIKSPYQSAKAASVGLASMIPALAAGAITKSPTVTTVGMAATVGLETAANGTQQYMLAHGINPSDPKEVEAYFRADPTRVDDALNYTAIHTSFNTAAALATAGASKYVGGKLIPSSGSVPLRSLGHVATEEVVGDATFAAAHAGANVATGVENTAKDTAMQVGSGLPFAAKEAITRPGHLRRADAARDTNILVRQLLEAEEAQRPVREKQEAEVKAAAEEKAKQEGIDEAFTQNEKEKSATPDQQAADQQEADYRNLETEREYAGKTRLVKYPDGSMERVPVHPPKELTGEDIANERLDKELQAEAKRIKDEEAESARVERVEVGGQQELLRKEQERAAATVKSDAEKLEKKQKESDANHKRTLAGKIVAENPGKTPQELQPLLAKALKDSPPPTVTLETPKKGKGKAQPKAAPAPAKTEGEKKPVPVRTQREEVVALLKEKAEANKAVPKPGEAVSETPVRDDAAMQDADVRALAAKQGIEAGKLNPDLDMASEAPAKDGEKPKSHIETVQSVIKALGKRAAARTRSLQSALASGKAVIVPSAKHVGMASEGDAVYRTRNGKIYIFADKLDMSNPVGHLLNSIPHESGHFLQDRGREGRSRGLEHILSPELNKKVADTIYNGYKKGNKIAKAAVENAEAAGVIETKDGVILDPERAKLELVPYFVGEAMKALENRGTLGTMRGVPADVIRGAKLALKEKLGLDMDVSLKDIEYLSQKVVDEMVATPVGEKSRIQENLKGKKAEVKAAPEPTPGKRETLTKGFKKEQPTKQEDANTDLEMLGSTKGKDFEEEKKKGNTTIDASGKEVFLIDNREAKILKDGYERLRAGDPTVELRDVYDHPELYRNYPELAHILMTVDPKMNAQGMWQPAKGSIKLGYHDNLNELLRTITHEAAHAVQDYEGMSPGTSPRAVMAERGYKDKASDATSNIIAEVKDLNDNGKFLPKIAAKWGFNSFPELKMAVLKSQKEHISGLTPEAIERFEFIASNVGNKSRRSTVALKLHNLISNGDITEFTHPALKKVLDAKNRIEQDAHQEYSNSLGERQAEEAARRLFTTDEEGNVVRQTKKDTVESFAGATNRGAKALPADAGIGHSALERLQRRAKAHAEEQGDIDLEMRGHKKFEEFDETQDFKLKDGRTVTLQVKQDPRQGGAAPGYKETPRDGGHIVATVGGKEVGSLTYMGGHGDIYSEVDPAYRRLGVGTLLYDSAETQGADIQGRKGSLSVSPDAEALRASRNARPPEDVDLEMLGFGKKKPKVDTPEEDLSPKEVLRRIQDTAIREQTADIKQGEDLDTRFRRALAIDGKGKNLAAVNEDIMAALTQVDEAGSKGRTEAMERFAAKYPKMAPIVAEMRATIDKATNNYIASELSTGRVLSPKARKTIKTLLSNEGRYITRAYSAFQRRVGRKWAENRWADYKGKLKQYLDDPTKLNEKQRDNVEALILGIDHLREKLVIPGDADLQELTTARLEQMYEDMNVGQVSRLDYNTHADDELAARRDALIEGLNEKRDATTPEEWDTMAEQAMKELMGLDKSSTSVTRKISELIRDPGTLKERENVHPAIRKALGEITNPAGRVLATLETQAALNARAHTINSILKDHLGEFVIPGTQINKGDNRKKFPVALKGEQYGSLNGYYATQHVADALVSNEQAYHTYAEAWRKVIKQPGIIAGKLWNDAPRYSLAPLTRAEKVGSVVARLASWPGNFGGSALNMLKSGNFSFSTIGSGIKDAGAFIKGTHSNTTTERLQDLLRYANIENVSVAEMQNVLGDKIKQYLDGEISTENVQDFIRNKEGGVSKGRRNWRSFLSTYAMLDAWTKIANYHDRLNMLTEYYKLTGSDKSMEQIKREAGHTTSYTNLSNERVPEILKAFEKRGFTKFIPYFSEVARTTWTNYQQAFLDLKRSGATKNPKAAALMRNAALKRFLGNTMATAALPSMAAVAVNGAMAAFGLAGQGFALAFNEEDAKKKRYLISEFNRYQDMLPFGKDAEGNEVYLPVSQRLDPNGPVTELTRIFANTDDAEATYEATKKYLSTLLITPLWATHLHNSMTMNTVPKSKIAANYPAITTAINDFFADIGVGPSPVNKALYSVESLMPNVVVGQDPKYDITFGEDADPAVVDTVKALEKMGMGFEKADLTKPLRVYGNDAAEAKTRNRAVFADDLLLEPVNDEKFADAVQRYALAERERFEEGQKSVEALRAWKVAEEDIPQMLVDAGWGKEEARNMVLGNNDIVLSLASLKQSKIGTQNSENTAEAVKMINESRAELEEMGIKVKRQ